jgi:hypothetical protein
VENGGGHVGGEVNVVDLLYQKELKARYTKLE